MFYCILQKHKCILSEQNFHIAADHAVLHSSCPVESQSLLDTLWFWLYAVLIVDSTTCFPAVCNFSTQKLTNMRIMKENMRTGNLPANMKKNRVLQIIPCKLDEGFR